MDLHTACKAGDLNNLKSVCEKIKAQTGAKTNEFLLKPDGQGQLPLDILVNNDRFECCKYLFDTYSLNPMQINENGTSAFALAIELNRINFLKYFIDNSKKYMPTKLKEDLLTAVSCTKSNQCPFQVVLGSAHPNVDKVLLLLLSYVKMTSSLRKSLFTGAVLICNINLIETVLQYGTLHDEERRELINLHFGIANNYMRKNLLSEADSTPLIYAINKKDRQLVNFLLSDENIDVNLPNTPLLNQSPLHLAIELNDLETVMMLVEKSVSKSKCIKGVLPLEHAINMRLKYLNNMDSTEASENYMIIELLSSNQNDIQYLNDSGLSPFDVAVKHQLVDVLEHFCSISQTDLYEKKNKHDKSPIDYAEPDFGKILRNKFPPA